jgi:hypothetical protein
MSFNSSIFQAKISGSQAAINSIAKKLAKFSQMNEEMSKSSFSFKDDSPQNDELDKNEKQKEEQQKEQEMLQQMMEEQNNKKIQLQIDELNQKLIEEFLEKEQKIEKEIIEQELEIESKIKQKFNFLSQDYFQNLNQSLDNLIETLGKCKESGANLSFSIEKNGNDNLENNSSVTFSLNKSPNSHLPNNSNRNNDRNIF